MTVLILGGSGMLGHKLSQTLSSRVETFTTFRTAASLAGRERIFDLDRCVTGVSAEDFPSVQGTLERIRPDVVVNCVGLVKQRSSAQDPIASIEANALFPHRVAAACAHLGARLIHVSTDCVFSGRKGHYSEADPPDPEDLYGRTKLLGEVDGPGCLTIRTSMIGRELGGAHGLLEWFMSRRGGTVRGFARAIFSGLTTAALSDIIGTLIADRPHLHGLVHVAGQPISKHDLLVAIRDAFSLDIEIEPDAGFVCDRSLDDARFRAATGISPPPWPEMIEALRRDPTPYEALRGTDAAH